MDRDLSLLLLKDTDIRLNTLRQCRTAVDKGIHIGGAFSCIVPLVALFYGSDMHYNVEHPTDPGQDQFLLSKGHAVAALASVYADLGYFPTSVLEGSRSWDSKLNGHPGPILPGIPLSTGPLGHGISAACGFAHFQKRQGSGDAYCLTGDGELQEGSNWEGFLYAPQAGLDNLCVIVDRNHGQSDDLRSLVVGLGDLKAKLEAFGWRVLEVDGTGYGEVTDAFRQFQSGSRGGRPTAILCNTRKGWGGFGSMSALHKATIPDSVLDREQALHLERREQRLRQLLGRPAAPLLEQARKMNYRLEVDEGGNVSAVEPSAPQVRLRKAPPRKKAVRYDSARLPVVQTGQEYACDKIVAQAMEVFAEDSRIWSIDSDLANTSGLQPGVAAVDRTRALNAGIAEAHMMNMAEALASQGGNVWNSTFSVFFDWRAFRRIAVSCQERLESMEEAGWLDKGHGLDITFLATAPNLETQTNGATHMGNDDLQVYGEIAHLQMIDICCPRQLLSAMEWICGGNKGLIYLRIPRMPTRTLYSPDYRFTFGRAEYLRQSGSAGAVLVSSGRGVHEALAAADLLEKECAVDVIDMPSPDSETLCRLARQAGKKPVLFAEQNNGYLYDCFLRTLAARELPFPAKGVKAVNCKDAQGNRRFLHSGTYGQLTGALGLDAESLAHKLRRMQTGQGL